MVLAWKRFLGVVRVDVLVWFVVWWYGILPVVAGYFFSDLWLLRMV